MPQTRTKQPSERFVYDMDMSPRIPAGDSLASIDSITEETENLDTQVRTASADLTMDQQSIANPKIQVRIAAGVNNTLYVITFKATTTNGNKVEAEGYLLVVNT